MPRSCARILHYRIVRFARLLARRRVSCPLLGLGILLALAPQGTARADQREHLVLLVNSAVPESVALAKRYCELRGISEAQICSLALPVGESLSRREYEEQLRDPLLAWLRDNGWTEQVKRNPRQVAAHESEWTTVKSKVRMICSFYGVPLRIEDSKLWVAQKIQNWIDHAPQRDEAAVDSELVMLLQGAYDIRGRVPNPFLGQLRWGVTGEQGLFFVMATRLDGPDPDRVLRMMQGAWDAEQYGLHGRAYFDVRAPHDDDYLIGDFWLGEAAARLSREGFECIVERTDQLFGLDFPMDSAAVYFGWYTDKVTGPFQREEFAFQPGALAYHNHSGNAKTLRATTNGWAATLLARGAAATWGSVSEPFLSTTPQLHILMDRLCRGETLAESTYLALSSFSWQNTVIGDPLYRPFALSLDQQIENLEAANRPEVEWAWVRKVNMLVQEGRLNLALAYARDRLRVRDSYLLRERMADLYSINGLPSEAVIHYEKALALVDRADTGLRIAVNYLNALRAVGQGDRAQTVEAELRERWAGSPYLKVLEYAHTPPKSAAP
ncbi:MAG: TIGR03790 family protein [Kiritimatiellae bacterium]|nr:TIGR03790 family protein [Kiritimatiellia bacterium]